MNRNDKELTQITEDNYESLYRFCRGKVRTDEDAFDITQDVFRALVEAYSKLRNKNAVRKWLYATAHNMIADYYKQMAKESENRTLDNTSDEELGLFYEMTEEVSDEEIEAYKKEALSILSEDDKKLYEEAVVLKRKPDDLATEYGISVDAMYKRIERLKKRIKLIAKQIIND